MELTVLEDGHLKCQISTSGFLYGLYKPQWVCTPDRFMSSLDWTTLRFPINNKEFTFSNWWSSWHVPCCCVFPAGRYIKYVERGAWAEENNCLLPQVT